MYSVYLLRGTGLFLIFLSIVTQVNCQGNVGDPCTADSQCRGNPVSAECSNQRCWCKSGYAPIQPVDFAELECLKILDLIGAVCLHRTQCQLGEPGNLSDCLESETNPGTKECTCVETAISEPGENICRKRAEKIGDDCEVNAQCRANLGDHALCVNEVCVCNTATSVENIDRTRCLPFLTEIGENCEQREQCRDGVPGDLSHCAREVSFPEVGDYVCACLAEAVHQPGEHVCYPKREFVKEECQVDAQCWANLSPLSECTGNECSCLSGESTPSLNMDKCLLILHRLEEICTEKQQCQLGLPGPLSDCLESPLNPVYSTCQCNSEATNEPGEEVCRLKAEEVGDDCDRNSQCEANLGEFGECTSGKCQCKPPPISIPNNAENKCLPIRNEIGEECEEGQQCTLGDLQEFSDCVLAEGGMVCNCTNKGIRDPDDDQNHYCFEKAVVVGDSCQIESQCTANLGGESWCNEGFCGCKSGFLPETGGTFCIRGPIFIGEPCTDSAQCVGEPDVTSECSPSDNICLCKSGYIASVGRETCLQIRNMLGNPCEERQQCQLGVPGVLSDCLPSPQDPNIKVCNCTEEAIHEGGEHKCFLKATSVGQQCDVNAQCLFHLVYSNCLDKKCTCLEEATPSTNRSRCVLKSFLGKECEDQEQCVAHIPNSSCQTQVEYPIEGKVCRCDEGYIHPSNVNNECYQLADAVGGSCSSHELQCSLLEDVLCNDTSATCECEDPTDVVSQSGKRCLDAIDKLHQPCEESVQCLAENSECLLNSESDQTECSCRRNDFVESVVLPGKCLRIVREVNLPCEESIQCSTGIGDKSECRGGMCQCSYGFVFYDGTCEFPVVLGQPCNSHRECAAGVNNLTMCTGARCTCAEGAFEFANSCWMEKRVGDSCRTTEECRVTIYGQVRCDTVYRICSCDIGHQPDILGKMCSNGSKFIINSFILLLCFLTIVTGYIN